MGVFLIKVVKMNNDDQINNPIGKAYKPKAEPAPSPDGVPRPGVKRAGKRKINIEFIEDKSRRNITFSKRKAGIIKKAYELSTLTGTQVLLLVASETGHVYTFATPKLQPIITRPEGKQLIQSCLNSADEEFPVPEPQKKVERPPANPYPHYPQETDKQYYQYDNGAYQFNRGPPGYPHEQAGHSQQQAQQQQQQAQGQSSGHPRAHSHEVSSTSSGSFSSYGGAPQHHVGYTSGAPDAGSYGY